MRSCRARTAGWCAARLHAPLPVVGQNGLIPGLVQREGRSTDFADGASRMSPPLHRGRDQLGSSVLLFLLFLLLQFAFLLRSTLGCFLLFPLSFVFFSLITHTRFSLLEDHLHQNVAQNPSSERQVQGIVAAQVGQRPLAASVARLGMVGECENLLRVSPEVVARPIRNDVFDGGRGFRDEPRSVPGVVPLGVLPCHLITPVG